MKTASHSRSSHVLRNLVAVAMIAAIPVLAACASIMHGTSEQIGISSTPTGAQVTVDKMEHGVTPVVVDLKRKDTHIISVTMAGYQPFSMALTRHVSGWVWGNIVFGGVVGLAVDAITGGLYKLEPSQVTADLHKTQPQVAQHGNALFVTVVLHPSPGMQRIGTLKPLTAR